jgi:hypothetical protein
MSAPSRSSHLYDQSIAYYNHFPIVPIPNIPPKASFANPWINPRTVAQIVLNINQRMNDSKYTNLWMRFTVLSTLFNITLLMAILWIFGITTLRYTPRFVLAMSIFICANGLIWNVFVQIRRRYILELAKYANSLMGLHRNNGLSIHLVDNKCEVLLRLLIACKMNYGSCCQEPHSHFVAGETFVDISLSCIPEDEELCIMSAGRCTEGHASDESF